VKKQLKLVAGVLGATLATQGMGALPANAAEFTLDASMQQFRLANGGTTSAASDGILIAPSPTNHLHDRYDPEWWDLLPEPDPDYEAKAQQGHLREQMSLAHLALGSATMGLLAGAGITGAMLVGQNDPNVRFWHQAMVGVGTATYLADGALMLFAPKPYKSKGSSEFSNIDAHRYLFYLHLAGMTTAVVTGLVATRLWNLDPSLDIRKSHPAVGGAAIGLIGVSATVMALNF
jgi:hypothetical protein